MDESTALAILVRAAAPVSALRELLREGGAAAALAGGPSRLRAAGLPPEAVARALAPDRRTRALDEAWLAAPNHRLLGFGDPDYPGLLRLSPHAPAALFLVGDAGLLCQPQIAVVGSRRPSAGGRDNARCFARAFAEAGYVVCSGLAEGIDAEAHLGALAAGRTIAVLGTGPDRCFPSINAPLMARIAAEGLIVSEHPPGTPGLASHFPSRNRIIAGLSQGTVVVEAALRSGALITGRLASEAGREAFALPGSIHNPMARGCHRLIREGAMLVESPQDVLSALGPVAAAQADTLREALAAPPPATRGADPDWTAGRTRRLRPVLAPTTAPDGASPTPVPGQLSLWRALGHDPVNIDQLCRRTGLTLGPLSAMLLAMELDGSITVDQGRYCRRSDLPPAHRRSVQAKG
jgi:DNA processing protein